MKKTFLFCLAMTGLVAVTSCSSEETVDEPKPKAKAIGFDSFINKSTRAEINNSNFNAFQVWALETPASGTGDFILSNATIKKNGGAWEYQKDSDKAYWRAGSCFTFLGVAPADKVSQAGGNVITVDADKTNPNLANILFQNNTGDDDLVAALNKTFSTTAWTTTGNTTANMSFCHLLTKIHFAFENAMEDGSMLQVSDVTITNSPRKGRAALTYDDTSAKTEATWAAMNAEPLSSSDAATLQFAGAIKTLSGETDTDVFENTTGYYIKNKKTAQTIEKLMIPVNTTALEVKFTINHKKGSLVTTYPKTVTVSMPEGGWKSGNCYQLVATIKAANLANGDMAPITFSASVVDWVENANQTQTLPESTTSETPTPAPARRR